MLRKFAVKSLSNLIAFVFMFLLGVISFNLFYLNEKLQMFNVVEAFHNGQINNDKKQIGNSLTDDFVETGAKFTAATPDVIYKSNVLNFDYSKLNFSIETNHIILLNLLSNSSNSLSFIRKLTLAGESGNTLLSVNFYVIYTFENNADGLKISKIERKF